MEEGTFCRGEIREQLETESETFLNPEKMFQCKMELIFMMIITFCASKQEKG